ncbi:MAG TPA: hypothetical protein VLK58_20035, partial [Conexibacter sp.]|nr:hypothetical protein [Conexibacter sp.]
PRLLPELLYWAMMPFLGHAAAAEEMERLRDEPVAVPVAPPAAVPPRRSGRRSRAGEAADEPTTVPPRRSGRRARRAGDAT